jgi:hypothetical protein
MLFWKIAAVYCENHTKHANIHCEQLARFGYVKTCGTHSDHWALKGYAEVILVINYGYRLEGYHIIKAKWEVKLQLHHS